MAVDAVLKFLANDWNRTDPEESSNDPQLVNVRKIREDGWCSERLDWLEYRHLSFRA